MHVATIWKNGIQLNIGDVGKHKACELITAGPDMIQTYWLKKLTVESQEAKGLYQNWAQVLNQVWRRLLASHKLSSFLHRNINDVGNVTAWTQNTAMRQTWDSCLRNLAWRSKASPRRGWWPAPPHDIKLYARTDHWSTRTAMTLDSHLDCRRVVRWHIMSSLYILVYCI